MQLPNSSNSSFANGFPIQGGGRKIDGKTIVKKKNGLSRISLKPRVHDFD